MKWEDYMRLDGTIRVRDFFHDLLPNLGESQEGPKYVIAVKYIELVMSLSPIRSREVAATIVAHAMMM